MALTLVEGMEYHKPEPRYPPNTGCIDAVLRFVGLRKVPPLRWTPLTTADEVLSNREAMERIVYALDTHPPGTVLRWDKLLTVANRGVEPSEEDMDPLRLDLSMEEFKLVLRQIYSKFDKIRGDGISLMRDFLPKMYDKHSLERGKRVSQKERDERAITDECFAYGELDPEIFVSIYHKVSAAYGKWERRPTFYDLGCGVGNLVYAAAFTGDFYKCGGIDGIQALVDRGEKRMPRWNRFKEGFPREIKRMKFLWENDNYLENPDVWRDATWILLHWTALNKEQLELAGDRLAQCREGCIIVSFTSPIMNSDFEILVKDTCEVSWGTAVFYVQEKLTPRKKVAGKVYDSEEEKDDEDDEDEKSDATTVVEMEEDAAEFMF